MKKQLILYYRFLQHSTFLSLEMTTLEKYKEYTDLTLHTHCLFFCLFNIQGMSLTFSQGSDLCLKLFTYLKTLNSPGTIMSPSAIKLKILTAVNKGGREYSPHQSSSLHLNSEGKVPTRPQNLTFCARFPSGKHSRPPGRQQYYAHFTNGQKHWERVTPAKLSAQEVQKESSSRFLTPKPMLLPLFQTASLRGVTTTEHVEPQKVNFHFLFHPCSGKAPQRKRSLTPWCQSVNDLVQS